MGVEADEDSGCEEVEKMRLRIGRPGAKDRHDDKKCIENLQGIEIGQKAYI